jgi:hypothetical protein
VGESLVASPAEHLKQLAAECRRLADTVHDEAVRRELILVAERFERLARVRGRRETAPRPKGSDC